MAHLAVQFNERTVSKIPQHCELFTEHKVLDIIKLSGLENDKHFNFEKYGFCFVDMEEGEIDEIFFGLGIVPILSQDVIRVQLNYQL